jgi:hypothetical protein
MYLACICALFASMELVQGAQFNRDIALLTEMSFCWPQRATVAWVLLHPNHESRTTNHEPLDIPTRRYV